MIRPAVFQDGKLVLGRSIGMTLNANPEYRRDIHIDRVYKEDGWLCAQTGNVVNRIRIEDAKKILKLLME